MNTGLYRPKAFQDFADRIERMNRVMKVSCPDQLTDLTTKRIEQFQQIMADELTEVNTMIGRPVRRNDGVYLSQKELVELADWLGDIIVYTMSEGRRWGIPMVRVLHAIMDSQDSKLDENGQPIHCKETGKFLKGPNYKPPEEDIRRILFPEPSAPTPDYPEADDGVSYEEEEIAQETLRETVVGTPKTVDGVGERAIGLVVQFPKSPTGYAKIVAYDPPNRKRSWSYMLQNYRPGSQTVDINPTDPDSTIHYVGTELDELIKVELSKVAYRKAVEDATQA